MAFQERRAIDHTLRQLYLEPRHPHSYTHNNERDEQITWLLCKFRYIAFCVFVEMQMAITLYQAKRTNERTNERTLFTEGGEKRSATETSFLQTISSSSFFFFFFFSLLLSPLRQKLAKRNVQRGVVSRETSALNGEILSSRRGRLKTDVRKPTKLQRSRR